MRISTAMLADSYVDTLNEKYADINKYSNQVSSTMAYDRASDDPVAAMQTIKACHEYTLNQQYQNSEGETASWMTSTESTLTEINSVLLTAQEKATECVNGTNNQSDLKNYSTAMTNYQKEIVDALNTTYSGKYIFGQGTDRPSPFRLGDDGKLQVYNYTPVTGLAATGYTDVSSLTSAQVTAISNSLSMKTDLGNGSSFEAATSGLSSIISDFSGTYTTGGVTTTGTATNIVDQLTTAIAALNSNNATGYSNLLTEVQGAQSSILKSKVDVGERSNMLSTIATHLTDTEANITSDLANCMEVDSVQAIMKYNTSQTVYKEAMSIASTVLQQSLFDFLK